MDDHWRRVPNRFDQLENRHQRAQRLKPAHADMNAVRLDSAPRLRELAVAPARAHDFFLRATRADRTAGPDRKGLARGTACTAIVSSTRDAMMSFSNSLVPS